MLYNTKYIRKFPPYENYNYTVYIRAPLHQCTHTHTSHIHTPHTHTQTQQIIIIMLVVAAIANFYFTYERIGEVQPRHFKPYSCMLWFIWVSVILLTLLLGTTWSIALILVNVGNLDLDTQTVIGWAFLGVSCALVRYLKIDLYRWMEI